MDKIWNKDEIQRYIDEEIEESLRLDYKASGALDKTDNKKKEITKDVSAMANSAGGLIIYGIKEYQEKSKKHKPEEIDGIKRSEISKEWLEHVISNIQPRIDGLLIHPITIEDNEDLVVYVVEIPKSNTAHQATNCIYYKRFNFESVPMEDYEVRDTMGRKGNPQFKLEFSINIFSEKKISNLGKTPEEIINVNLLILATNVGKVYANYVNAYISIPVEIAHEVPVWQTKESLKNGEDFDKVKTIQYTEDNTVRDVVDWDMSITGPSKKYGPARYQPILPGLTHSWHIALRDDIDEVDMEDLNISWTLYADNARPISGTIKVSDIRINDRRSE